MKLTIFVLLGIVSPTYLYADRRKAGRDRLGRAKFIIQMNRIYLIVGILVAVAAFCMTRSGIGQLCWATWWPLVAPVTWYLALRCNEVFVAFYKDAFAKLRRQRRPTSALAWSTRIRLALNSYVELILNFAVLYAMLPAYMWQVGQRPTTFTDLLTYSALTITTSGGGGFVAWHWLPQFMTVYEVLCGLILLVVSFTIYTRRALAGRPKAAGYLRDSEPFH